MNQTMLFRGSFRARTLPYEASSQEVNEKTISLGSGLALAGGRMAFDVTGMRQFRNVSLPGVRERAWTLSLSLTARP
jgi:hypothetical protein